MPRAMRNVPALKNVQVRDSVYLRPLQKGDAKALLAILDDDATIRERVGVASALYTVDDIDQLIKKEQDNKDIIRYVIVENTLVVGLVSFWRAGEFFGQRAQHDDYGFGYFLAPGARGRGLVTGSLTALMSVAEQELGATSFIAFCEKDNIPSGTLLKKVGLEPTSETWVEPTKGWVEQKYQRKI